MFTCPAIARAQAVVTGDFKALKHTGSGRIDKIIDGETILLQDGKIIRLLGLKWPLVMDGDSIQLSSPESAERLTQRLPASTEIMLYQTRNGKTGRVNRMGHLLAHVVVKKTDEWINGDLVAQGLAYAATDESNPEMADQLYILEERARQTKTPLWQGPYGLLRAEDAEKRNGPFQDAINGNGSFRVVEGIVNRSGTASNNLYLNFGKDRHKDFTVQITPAIRKTLAHNGIDPMGLAGKKVRVRGWLRFYDGPYMELETPERIEILDLPTTVTDPQNAQP